MEFPVSGKYSATLNEGSLGVRGDRVTKLGTNMYSKVRPSDTTVSTETQQKKAQSVEQVSGRERRNCNAKTQCENSGL